MSQLAGSAGLFQRAAESGRGGTFDQTEVVPLERRPVGAPGGFRIAIRYLPGLAGKRTCILTSAGLDSRVRIS